MNNAQSPESLLSKLKTFTEVSDEVLQDLIPILENKSFKKNEIILSEGEVAEYVYYILSGCVRFYYLNNKKEDITTFFIMENEFFSNSSSFLTGEPSEINIATLEPVETFRIHKQHLHEMYVKHPTFEKIARGIIENALVNSIQKNPPNTLSAEERYLHLLKKNPEFVKRIPIKYLAPFLGIHPNSLSRIRKDIKL